MRKIVAFYAWQSDKPSNINHNLIGKALRDAAKRITDDASLDVEILIDSDTQGVPGTPAVTETILSKIETCDIFIADVTFVASTDEGKLIPNPNVMAEFGYALRAKTNRAVMHIMNIAFGPPEELPFDLGHFRHPIQFLLAPNPADSERRAIRTALSKDLEEKLRLQIAATEPPPPVTVPFSEAKPKDGPARFRAPGQPIGKRWSDLPISDAPDQEVVLLGGAAMWLRLMPVVDTGKLWSALELGERAMTGGVRLAPLCWSNPFRLRAGDGFGIGHLTTPEEISTPSVAFAFRTGEIWSVDVSLFRHPQAGLNFGEIKTRFANCLVKYSEFLGSLGINPPYQWISGITGASGRTLIIPGTMNFPMFPRHECMVEDIIAEGQYDGMQSADEALAPFFRKIYDECGAKYLD